MSLHYANIECWRGSDRRGVQGIGGAATCRCTFRQPKRCELFLLGRRSICARPGLLPVRLNLLVSIGTVDLLTLYGGPLGSFYPLAVYGLAAMWLLVMLGLGFAGRSGFRWAFLAGIAIYAVDMIALILTFSLWAFGVHAFFVFKWFQGQKALKDLNGAGVSTI